MKIKTTIQPKPKVGDAKSKLVFALFPHRIQDQLIWLERYEVLYIWTEQSVQGEVLGKPLLFNIGKWTKVSEARI